MIRQQFDAILRELNDKLEGDAFRLNLNLNTGRVLNDYAVERLDQFSDVIRCLRDDHPPIYMALSAISFVELSNG